MTTREELEKLNDEQLKKLLAEIVLKHYVTANFSTITVLLVTGMEIFAWGLPGLKSTKQK